MKYLKKFETGEWLKKIDWNYVKKYPDNDSDEAQLIIYMEEQLNEIRDYLEDSSIFEIIDIRGFDMYQGCYGIVKIFNKIYSIWSTVGEELWIEDFPIDTTGDKKNKSGYNGYPEDISNLLNDINNIGSIEEYLKIKK